MESAYILGIDLGTTNSVIAYTKLPLRDTRDVTPKPEIRLLPIPQVVAPGTIESRTLLPSFLYLGTENERTAHVLDLPWSNASQNAAANPTANAAQHSPNSPLGEDHCVGEYARRQGAESPDRTVGAAKSWLGNHHVDRRKAILPWNPTSHDADGESRKISPLAATQAYLEHLMATWNAAFPDAPAKYQQIVLTVPASFDASARELTREAALAAGLPDHLVLLEEPQACVYAWLAEVGERWRKTLKCGDRLLVCDVGGGTTDFSLVEVSEEKGELQLQRLAVGDHLLLGGDNMDLFLAHFASQKLAEKGVKLDPWQSVSLWHSCRAAKESLLAPRESKNTGEHPDTGNDRYTLTIQGRGRRLIGGAVTLELSRADIAEKLVEGFFPLVAIEERPKRSLASGFRQLGLPYEQDTAVTRHLAAFLSTHSGNTNIDTHSVQNNMGELANTVVRPTHLLFNGGVFKAAPIRERITRLFEQWFPKDGVPQTLDAAEDLDHAVARGAVGYGWSKSCGGIRIRGGTARAYYVGIESAGLAIPGMPRPVHALCVAPIGMEEGSQCVVPSAEIGLVVEEPSRFRFFSSSVRRQDKPGTLLPYIDEDEIQETDSMEMTISANQFVHIPESTDSNESTGRTAVQPGDEIPVRFESRITELGVLELWCHGTRQPGSWKFEFNIRSDD
ncbi:MAG: Hsp70 family protein [Thermoguttaceae bacterium]|nr:Hsp70 family protein [Thermoguttaceae bacterium]